MKKRVTRSDENAVRQLFQDTGKIQFFMGAALIGSIGRTVSWGKAPDDKIADLLVTLEFDLTKHFPAIEELSKNAAVMGQIIQPWCNHHRLQGSTRRNRRNRKQIHKLMSKAPRTTESRTA